MNIVYIGLGANLGNREENIRTAIGELGKDPDIEVQGISSFIETDAVADIPQPKFINAACKIQTFLTAGELLTYCQDIEQNLGRASKGDNEPRPIDLDILFYNNEIISEDHLIIPHPLLHERRFVLEPLSEIAPSLKHPILQLSIQDLLEQIQGY